MTDIAPPVPYDKAREFAVACMSDDPDNFYRPFEMGRDDLPDLPADEYVLVEFRRIKKRQEDVVELAVPEYAGEGVA